MILVTGGAGFIGSNLVRRLLSDGEAVTVIDNLSTGSVDNLPKHPKLTFIQSDIISLGTRMRDIDTPDVVFHLACPASPKAYQSDAMGTIRSCVWGTMSVLVAAAYWNNAHVLHASTSEIYGDPEVHPQPETYRGNVNPIGPRACYNEAKRLAETMCMTANKQFKSNIKIARIFNTYGPYMAKDDGRVVSNFITQALEGKDLTVYGGDQTRSFCYVDDTVDGLIELSRTNHYTPVNIGNPEELTIRQLADKIASMIDHNLAVNVLPVPEDDPTRRCPDISLAKSILEWEPQINLDYGLQKTIDYFKSCGTSGQAHNGQGT